MSVQFPAISVHQQKSPRARITIKAALSYTPPLTKVEASQPTPTDSSGFGWTTSADLLEPGVLTISSIPGEAASNRNLFIAGAFIGLAGGLLTWVLQLLLEAIPPRRRGHAVEAS